MRRVFTGIATGVALAALIGSAAACGSSGGSGGDTDAGGVDQVKVGVIPIVDVAPIYLGQQKGFFKNRNIELTMESGQGGAAIVPGVVSGQFQFGFSNFTSLLLAQTKNVPIKTVANGVASTGEQGKDFGAVMVKKDSPIKTAADLAGKKVSVNTLKNIGDTTVRESVRKAGGDPKNINFVEVPFANAPAALEEGQVDAVWVVEPSLTQVKAAGGRMVASNYVDAAPDLSVAAYFTSAKLAGEDADLVKRFTEAINESLTYADGHPDEVRAILGSYTKIDEKTRADLTLPKWPVEINKESVDTLAKLGAQDGIFDGATPDVAKLLP
jgi:NitT/TauT family transport system substrate-binding protein